VTSIFPVDDDFTEYATHYGAGLKSYIRVLPWKTAGDTVTDFAIPLARGDLHKGYFTGRSQFAAFIGQGVSGANNSLCALLWRQAYLANVRVGLSFRMLAVLGAVPASSFRWAGVTARNVGGSYDETLSGGSQHHIYDNSGYWFLFVNKPGVSGVDTRFLLLRVNSGVITVLAQDINTNNALANTLLGSKLMEMTVEDVAGNPVITCTYDGETIFEETDSSGSKLTAAGRAGFGMCRDRQESGPFNSAHVAAYWEVFDVDAGETVVRDEWDRVNWNTSPQKTDGNGTVGKLLMSMWTLDQFSPLGYTGGTDMTRDAGNDRIEAEGGTYCLSQIPASDIYEQARSCIFRTNNTPGTARRTGIILRGTFNTGGTPTAGYRVYIDQDDTTKTITITRVGGGNLASANVASGFGLTYGTDFELRVEVFNHGGTKPANGTPAIRAFINGDPVLSWTLLQAGITELVTGEVLDGQAGALLSGQAQGIEINGTGATSMFFDEWTDEVVTLPTVGDGDQESIPLAGECDGKTGTFTVPYDWPVEVLPRFTVTERRYASNHTKRILRARRMRRVWRIGAAAVTDAERAALLTFWDAHDGVQIPFDFPDPEQASTLVCAHFKDHRLGTVLRNPGVHSFDIVIEELLDP
jgi:hypothetical protein